jgi:lysophospholipase L1-like esterase
MVSVVLIGVIVGFGLLRAHTFYTFDPMGGTITFMPLGDSYTIGEGVAKNERWPNQLVSLLRKEGYTIELIGNPAVSGYTTRNAIDLQLPQLLAAKPDVATILLGANDVFRGHELVRFQREYTELVDKVQATVSDPHAVILVTIPDFTVTDMGRQYGSPYMKKNLEEYNRVIRDEGARRGLPVAELANISQEFVQNGRYLSPDGLHPSAAEYARWANEMKPHMVRIFTTKKQ